MNFISNLSMRTLVANLIVLPFPEKKSLSALTVPLNKALTSSKFRANTLSLIKSSDKETRQVYRSVPAFRSQMMNVQQEKTRWSDQDKNRPFVSSTYNCGNNKLRCSRSQSTGHVSFATRRLSQTRSVMPQLNGTFKHINYV